MPKTKICKKCGAQMDVSAKVCPQCGAPSKGKKGLIIGAVVVFIVLVAAIGNAEDNSSNTEPRVVSQIESSEIQSQNEVKEETKADDKTTVSEEASSQEKASSQEEVSSQEELSNVFHVGDVIDTGKATITFKSAEDYTTDNMFMQPEEGNKIIAAYFIVENTGDSDLFTGPFDFDCYADDTTTEALYFSDKALSSDSVSPGRKSEGYIWFEVPENAKKIEIEYEMSWWTQEKAIFIVKE